MTLAVILSICVLCFAPIPAWGAVHLWMQSAAQQSAPATAPDPSSEQGPSKAAQNPPASEPQKPPSASAPPATSPSSASAQKSDRKAAASKPRRRKKAVKTAKSSDCAQSASGKASSSPPEPAARAKAAGTGSAPPANCPPAKTVVHEGGTSEPAIQLVGGAGGQQAADQRLTTDQLVGSTQENLQKIAGRQLDANQQEMLKQIQQFLDQSKAAVAAGDVERGHNLAMKAHLLSDELAKP